jgi:hypothetical protein
MRELPYSKISLELTQKLGEIGKFWASSPDRPSIQPDMKHHWDTLIDDWANSDIPLVVRKGGGVRGGIVRHSRGRTIILSDNSPAQWVFMRAYQQTRPSLDEIPSLLRKIPFAFVATRADKSKTTYKGTLQVGDNLGNRGWRLCHIKPIGLRTREPVQSLPIEKLLDHFRLLLKPSNFFLVPLSRAGLGELSEVIDEVRKFEARASA